MQGEVWTFGRDLMYISTWCKFVQSANKGNLQETSRYLTALSAFVDKHGSAGPPLEGLCGALEAVLFLLSELSSCLKTHMENLRSKSQRKSLRAGRAAMAALPWLQPLFQDSC